MCGIVYVGLTVSGARDLVEKFVSARLCNEAGTFRFTVHDSSTGDPDAEVAAVEDFALETSSDGRATAYLSLATMSDEPDGWLEKVAAINPELAFVMDMYVPRFFVAQWEFAFGRAVSSLSACADDGRDYFRCVAERIFGSGFLPDC